MQQTTLGFVLLMECLRQQVNLKKIQLVYQLIILKLNLIKWNNIYVYKNITGAQVKITDLIFVVTKPWVCRERTASPEFVVCRRRLGSPIRSRQAGQARAD
jgi:hypothetical protein